MTLRSETRFWIVVAVVVAVMGWWLWGIHARVSAENKLLELAECGAPLPRLIVPHTRENRLTEIRNNLRSDPNFYVHHCEEQRAMIADNIARTGRALAGHDLAATGRVKTERQWLEAIERCRAAGWEAVGDMADTQSPQERRESSLILVSTRCTPPE